MKASKADCSKPIAVAAIDVLTESRPRADTPFFLTDFALLVSLLDYAPVTAGSKALVVLLADDGMIIGDYIQWHLRLSL